MQIQNISISNLTLLSNNPRQISKENLARLKRDIESDRDFLNKRPVLVNKVGDKLIVYAGNMRVRACIDLGYKEIPCIIDENLSDELMRKRALIDNQEYGTWDWDILANEWQEDIEKFDLPELNLEALGITVDDDVSENADDVPEVETKTCIKRGDLIQLGRHKVLCGDSTNKEDVKRLMENEFSELLFTSPPYLDMRDYRGGKNLEVDYLVNFISCFYPYCNYQVINLGLKRENNEVVEWWRPYIDKAKECGYKFLSWNVWDKIICGSIAAQTSMFGICHEWLFVFGKKRKDLNRIIPNDIEANKKRFKTITGRKVKRCNKIGGEKRSTTFNLYEYKQPYSVTHCYCELIRDEFTTKHQAVFPVALPLEYIMAMTDENDIVVDSFLGSGTTLIACEQVNRVCRGIEIDEYYCQVIVDRYCKFVNNYIVDINGKSVNWLEYKENNS